MIDFYLTWMEVVPPLRCHHLQTWKTAGPGADQPRIKWKFFSVLICFRIVKQIYDGDIYQDCDYKNMNRTRKLDVMEDFMLEKDPSVFVIPEVVWRLKMTDSFGRTEWNFLFLFCGCVFRLLLWRCWTRCFAFQKALTQQSDSTDVSRCFDQFVFYWFTINVTTMSMLT